MFDRFMQLLRKIPELKYLTDKEIRYLLNHVGIKIVDYEENQMIIRESEFNNYIYIMLEGKAGYFVNNWKTDCEIEMSVDELHVGDIIGEVDLRKKLAKVHSDPIHTLEKSTLFKIDRRLLFNYLKNSYTESEENETLSKEVI